MKEDLDYDGEWGVISDDDDDDHSFGSVLVLVFVLILGNNFCHQMVQC